RARKASARQPEFFIESNGIDDQRIFFPMAYRIAVIARDLFGSRSLRASVGVDHPPVAVPAAEQHQNAADFFLLDELKSVRHLKLPRSAGRNAARERIVFQERSLAMFEDRFSPGLHRRGLVG